MKTLADIMGEGRTSHPVFQRSEVWDWLTVGGAILICLLVVACAIIPLLIASIGLALKKVLEVVESGAEAFWVYIEKRKKRKRNKNMS